MSAFGGKADVDYLRAPSGELGAHTISFKDLSKTMAGVDSWLNNRTSKIGLPDGGEGKTIIIVAFKFGHDRSRFTGYLGNIK